MNRKTKLFFSLVSLCFSIAVLCFGVYSALSVSYSISGSVSYKINDVFVNVTRKVYRALSETPVQSSHSGNVTELKTAQTIDTSKYDDIGAGDSFSTYDNGKVTSSGQDYTYPEDGDESKNIDLTYGSPTNDNQGYAFYIVIDIHNLGSEIINAQITAPTSLENTILRDSGNVEITADDTERIVLGLALDDVTKGITSAGFTYTITISRGELPIEPITDMLFSVDEGNETATLTSYTGSGTMVEIPETIGTIKQTTKTLGPYADINTLMTLLPGTSTGMVDMFLIGDITYDGLDEPIENQMITLWVMNNENAEYTNIKIECKDRYTLTVSASDMENEAGMAMRYGPAAGYILPALQGDLTILDTMDMSYTIWINDEEFDIDKNEFKIDKNAVMQFIENKSGDFADYIDLIGSLIEGETQKITVTFEDIVYGDGVTEDGEYTVTSIGSGAFNNCSKLTSIEIPSGVASIGDSAFSGCSALKEVNITDIDAWAMIGFANAYANPLYNGADLYLNEKKVTEATLTTATKISPYAFYGHNSLTRITILSSVTSIGDGAFADCSLLGTVTFGENSQLGSIGDYAFYNCDALATVTFGANSQLESIGEYAFSDCSNLNSIEIPSRVTSIGYNAFEYCSALKEVNITDINAWAMIDFGGYDSNPLYDGAELYLNGESVIEVTLTTATKISPYAFYSYNSLTRITIQSSVRSIGSSAFNNCDALGTVTFGEDSKLESIGNDAFYDCSNLTSIEIPSSVTSIGFSAFNNCDALETVTFGEDSKLESIGNDAFYDCSNLNSIEIPSRVTSIGGSAFNNCSALKKVNITDIDAWAMIDFGIFDANPLYNGADLYLNEKKVTEVTLTTATKIEDYAFYRYDSLTRITIQSSVRSIGSSAFGNCSALGTVTFGEDSKLESIGSSAFGNCSALGTVTFGEDSKLESIGSSAFSGCSALTSIEIPSGVASIGDSAFSGCSALGTVTFGANSQLESIGSSAFSNCSNLTSIAIPSRVKSIGGGAFQNCSNLNSIEIPSSVTSIGERAFDGCSALKKVNITDIDAWAMIDFGFLDANPLYNGADLYLNEKKVTEATLTTATKIEDCAFLGYDSLTSIAIPSSVTSIGSDAFYDCSNLTSIKIPSSVTSIGDLAFYNCSKLSSVYIDGQAVANMLAGEIDASGLLGNIDTSEKVYINNTLTLTGGAKTYMESNFEIVTSDVSGYVCYQKK